MTAWRPVDADPAWLLHEAVPRLLVRTLPLEFDPQVALEDDAETFVRLVVELVAHEATDEQLGAFVRLEADKRLAAIRAAWSGKWSRRVVRLLEDATSPAAPGEFPTGERT